jgi:protein involved in polysaccharide export with SLBB domain
MLAGRADRSVGTVSARHFVAICSVSIGLFASACGGGSAPPATPAELQQLQQEAAAPPRLHAGEKIRVTVYGENSLSGEYQIDRSGFASMPLAGAVKAEGLTQHELEEALEQRFKSGYLKDPKVTVSIIEFRPFYILGEVEKPGSYPYSTGLNVMSAIATAGGTTYRANQSSVLIQHPGENELRSYDTTRPIPILPGDIIQIPRRYF